MGRKTKYNKEMKLEIVKRYLKGESTTLLANEYSIPISMRSEIRRWAHKYEVIGERAFETTKIILQSFYTLQDLVLLNWASSNFIITECLR